MPMPLWDPALERTPIGQTRPPILGNVYNTICDDPGNLKWDPDVACEVTPAGVKPRKDGKKMVAIGISAAGIPAAGRPPIGALAVRDQALPVGPPAFTDIRIW